MNKAELEEVIKIMREPVTVNSTVYKYFTQEQYDKLIRVYENAMWLVDYSIKQGELLQVLDERIEKAIEIVGEIKLHYQNNPTMIPSVKVDRLEKILKGMEEK